MFTSLFGTVGFFIGLIVVSSFLFEYLYSLSDFRFYASFCVGNFPILTEICGFTVYNLVIMSRFKYINKLFLQLNCRPTADQQSIFYIEPESFFNYNEILSTYNNKQKGSNISIPSSRRLPDSRSVIRKMIDYFTICKVSVNAIAPILSVLDHRSSW